MAPPLRPWADLHADLFLVIVDHLRSLRDYVSVRGVCAAWRSALPSASPYLLLDDLQPPVSKPVRRLGFPCFNTRAYALSIPMQRRFDLPKLRCHISCVTGSSQGYLAVADDSTGCRRVLFLNPVSGQQIELLPLPYDGYRPYPRRVVLGPNPRPGRYTALALCDYEHATKVAYVTSRDTGWKIAGVDGTKLVDLVYDAQRGHAYCLNERGDVQAHRIPRRGHTQTVEPLLLVERVIGACFDTHTPPYDFVSRKISFKRLFLCEGGVFTMFTDEILVLKYYPERWLCWDVVKDLGGYAVFIVKNDTAVVKAEAALGGVALLWRGEGREGGLCWG
uniref:KIB1-4 beta-propeller domain-containing protein n=1 Tax=Aegilops tauschii TaxID=37682 RepID=R7WCY4_AEGTA